VILAIIHQYYSLSLLLQYPKLVVFSSWKPLQCVILISGIDIYFMFTDRSDSYLDLHFKIDSEGRLRTKLYDKRDDFNFAIVNCPFTCSNIPTVYAYGLYIFMLIRYSRGCGSYQDVLDRGYCWQGSYWTKGSSWLSWSHHFESFMFATMSWLTNIEYHRYVPLVVNTSRSCPQSWFISGFVNTTGVTSGARTAYPSGTPAFTPEF
jgi:hypothetical protein